MEATQSADTEHYRDYSVRRYNMWRLLSQQIQYIIEIIQSEDTIYAGYPVSRYITWRLLNQKIQYMQATQSADTLHGDY